MTDKNEFETFAESIISTLDIGGEITELTAAVKNLQCAK